MLALYRKYRPKTFSEIIGQEHIVRILKNALIYNKIAHAYLFCGPRGVGKTTIARILAKAANCLNLKKDGEPCNECAQCREINDARSIDLIEIDAASHTSVDNVRENIINSSRFSPTKSKFKVYIIDEAHMLSSAAFNALLKTMEEPPAHCIFILATTAAHKIPATILSRCQRFDFRRLSQMEITDHLRKIADLEKIKIEKDALSLIAREAAGSSRDSLSLLGQIISLENHNVKVNDVKEILGLRGTANIAEFVSLIVDKNNKAVIEKLNQMAQDGADFQQFTKELVEYLRKILLLKIDANFSKWSEFSLTNEEIEAAKKHGEKISQQDIINLIYKILAARRDIDNSFLPQLPLELALVDREVAENDRTPQEGNSEREDVVREKVKTLNNISAQILKTPVKNSSVHREMNGGNKPRTTDSVVEALKYSASCCSNDLNFNQNNTVVRGKQVTFETIKKDWPKIQEIAMRKNFSLSAFLRTSAPIDFKDGYLILACKYKFHKERLEDRKIRQLLEEILSEVMQAKILTRCMISNNEIKNRIAPTVTEQNNNIASAAVELFG